MKNFDFFPICMALSVIAFFAFFGAGIYMAEERQAKLNAAVADCIKSTGRTECLLIGGNCQ